LVQSAKRRASLKEVKRVRTALSLGGIMIKSKDANLIKDVNLQLVSRERLIRCHLELMAITNFVIL
jgi:hypothetical protein